MRTKRRYEKKHGDHVCRKVKRVWLGKTILVLVNRSASYHIADLRRRPMRKEFSYSINS